MKIIELKSGMVLSPRNIRGEHGEELFFEIVKINSRQKIVDMQMFGRYDDDDTIRQVTYKELQYMFRRGKIYLANNWTSRN